MRSVLIPLILAVSALLSSSAIAGDSNSDERLKIKQALENLSDSDLIAKIESLDEKGKSWVLDLLDKDIVLRLPSSIIKGKDNKGFTKATELLALSRLLYPATQEGIKEFQTDIGAAATGELTIGELMELGYRANSASETKVIAFSGPPFISFIEYPGFGSASVRGTWVFDNNELIDNISVTEITCRHEENKCTSINAELKIPKIRDNPKDEYNSSEDYGLNLWSESYTLDSWDKSQIVAHIDLCGTTQLTLDISRQEVREVASGNGVCQPYVAHLKNGLETSQAVWHERRMTTCGYYNQRVMGGLLKDLQVGKSNAEGGCPSAPVLTKSP